MKKNNIKDYFPNNYDESRAVFIADSSRLQKPIEMGSWKIESKVDPNLSVDYTWLPPTKRSQKLLILVTGIHGSETYAGAAILKLIMEEILPITDRSDLGILLVHSMNPYGFKYHRRCTENNVNLNRNFSNSGEIFKIRNPESKRLNELVFSRTPVESEESQLIKSMRREDDKFFFNDVSLDYLIKTLSPGQFEDEKHFEYGGKSLEPQTKFLIEKIKSLMPDFKDVIAFDLHTGLGDRGRLHLLTDGDPRALNSELFSTIFKPDEDQDFYVFTPAATEGFYKVHGATNSLFAELANDSQRVCAITMEFGTLGHSLEQQIKDLNTSTLDHQGQFFGYSSEQLKQKIQSSNFGRSYPDDDDWRKQILTAAEGTLQKILSRF